MGGSFKPASAVARIGGAQAGFYGHGVPALSRCAHADDAASSRCCLSRQEGPGDSGSSSRAAGGAPALRSSLGGSGALCPAGALVRPRRCVPAPRCSATQKAEGARSRKNSGRSGNVGREGSGQERNQEKGTSMKVCPVCESTLFDDMDTCFGCLYRFGSDPALEAARSAKAVPWPVDGGEGECAASRGGEGGSAAPAAQEMSVPGWRLRVRSEGLQPRGSSLTIEIEPV